MLHAKSGGRGGRAGHSCEMTSHHSHTPAQECWENRQGGWVDGWDAGWEVGGRMSEQGMGGGGFRKRERHKMKEECHFIRPVVMGFQKELL